LTQQPNWNPAQDYEPDQDYAPEQDYEPDQDCEPVRTSYQKPLLVKIGRWCQDKREKLQELRIEILKSEICLRHDGRRMRFEINSSTTR
jgi:hypothetical protein